MSILCIYCILGVQCIGTFLFLCISPIMRGMSLQRVISSNALQYWLESCCEVNAHMYSFHFEERAHNIQFKFFCIIRSFRWKFKCFVIYIYNKFTQKKNMLNAICNFIDLWPQFIEQFSYNFFSMVLLRKCYPKYFNGLTFFILLFLLSKYIVQFTILNTIELYFTYFLYISFVELAQSKP